jgi:hypothetical protein
MRYSDFKLVETIKVNEEAKADLEIQHAMHDLDSISKSLPNISPENAKKQEKLLTDLTRINTALENFLDKAQGRQQATEAVQDNTDKLYTIKDFEKTNKLVQDTVKKLSDNLTAIHNLPDGLEGVNKVELVQNAVQALDMATKSFEELTAQRDQAATQRDEAINFVKEVTGILVTLGNKVQGFREDEDLDNFSGREKTAYKKMAVNAQKFTKTLKQALFGKILDMQEGSNVTGEEIKQFLQACADGKVINMLGVISVSKGNIKDHVNPKHQKVFDVFVEENIFSYAPGTTSGAIGPGEMALSMMGNPAEKGKTGDLRIGDEEIEIKASAKTGGRFNSKAIAKATTGWKVWAQKINQIMSQAPEDATISVTQKNGQEELIKAREYNGNRHNVIKGKAKEGSKYNWNASGFKALNIEVLKPYSNLSQTYDLFESSIRAIVQNYDKLSKPQQGNSHHKPFNPGDLIEAAINDDGTVDMKKMNIAYSKIAYASYHLADGITTVMLLRTDTLDYTIFKDADELVGQLSSGQAMTGGGFNWNDDQQTPTPGYIAS